MRGGSASAAAGRRGGACWVHSGQRGRAGRAQQMRSPTGRAGQGSKARESGGRTREERPAPLGSLSPLEGAAASGQEQLQQLQPVLQALEQLPNDGRAPAAACTGSGMGGAAAAHTPGHAATAAGTPGQRRPAADCSWRGVQEMQQQRHAIGGEAGGRAVVQQQPADLAIRLPHSNTQGAQVARTIHAAAAINQRCVVHWAQLRARKADWRAVCQQQRRHRWLLQLDRRNQQGGGADGQGAAAARTGCDAGSDGGCVSRCHLLNELQ